MSKIPIKPILQGDNGTAKAFLMKPLKNYESKSTGGSRRNYIHNNNNKKNKTVKLK